MMTMLMLLVLELMIGVRKLSQKSKKRKLFRNNRLTQSKMKIKNSLNFKEITKLKKNMLKEIRYFEGSKR